MKFAVLGNGVVEKDCSAEIDAADCVVRINTCKNYGGNAGRRTDVLALTNTGGHMPQYMNASVMEWPAFRACTKVVLPRSRLLYAAMQAVYFCARPKMAHCFREESRAFAAEARRHGKHVERVGFFEGLSLLKKLKQRSPRPFLMPSTGMIMIECLIRQKMKPGDSLTIYGFQHKGWEEHPWEAERALIDEYAREGLLRRG